MDDRLRASDGDQERTAAVLREHFAAGRLTAGELDELLTAALNARTLGDLRRVLTDLPAPAPVLAQASRLPPQAAALERSYRRLLAFYPAGHRRVHEDEMVAVLMSGAPEEKRRPGIGETADLLLGALRVRCQPSPRDAAEPVWRDALAVLSVIVPVIFLLIFAVQETQMLLSFPAPGAFAYGFPLWVLQSLAPPLAMAALVLLALRMRRAAAVAAAALLIWLVSGLPSQGVGLALDDAYLFLAVGLEIAALTASPGPRRGLQLLTRKHWALVIIATLALGTGAIPITHWVQLIVLAVIGAVMALASPLGRWLLVLLAIPAYPLIVGLSPSPPGFPIDLDYLPVSLAQIAPIYLPPLALLFLAIVAAHRGSVRSPRSGTASSHARSTRWPGES
jgi:hypothetical protein